MYVVTFYSFKGGVGRTLALMNCAAALVKEGKTVLTVDFDLEAPGLDTFNVNLPRRKKIGIVDYVTQYLENDVVPDIDAFLYKAKLPQENPGELWVMPAGNRDRKYHERLNSISWRHLYDYKLGFYLLANLKAQWEKHLNPDYVLIDSRTGHTDTSGICTRQLPDAVVILYFPNKQNLMGLNPIVEKIRNGQKNSILHSVASNVPDIDDEHSILSKNMRSFRRELGNMESMNTIHHYPSLPLLNQELFVLTRPKSRLASEYRRLTKSIQKENLQDEIGAMMYLRQFERGMMEFEISEENEYPRFDLMENRIDQILTYHHSNVNIIAEVVQIYYRFGDYEAADRISDRFIDLAPENSKLMVLKARIARQLGQKKIAENYAEKAASLSDLSYYEIQHIIQLLRIKFPESIDRIASWPSVTELEPSNLLLLARGFSGERDSLKIAEQLIRAALDKVGDDYEIKVANELIMNLIGQRKFDNAIQLAKCYFYEDNPYQQISFNLAMANWGANEKPNSEDFRRVVTDESHFTKQSEASANYCQCLSLVFYILGDSDKAIKYLEVAKSRIQLTSFDDFSCWTYLYLNAEKFQRDLAEQEMMINGEKLLPRVIRDNPDEWSSN